MIQTSKYGVYRTVNQDLDQGVALQGVHAEDEMPG